MKDVTFHCPADVCSSVGKIKQMLCVCLCVCWTEEYTGPRSRSHPGTAGSRLGISQRHSGMHAGRKHTSEMHVGRNTSMYEHLFGVSSLNISQKCFKLRMSADTILRLG